MNNTVQQCEAMTFVRKFQACFQGIHPAIYCSIILFLVSYVSVDVLVQDAGVCSNLSADALRLREGKIVGDDAQSLVDKWNNREDKFCGSILGHLPAKPNWIARPGENPWHQVKWIGKPARCRVKGQLIEMLDDTYNFRRGYALKYVADAEDKLQLLPWLLGNKVNLNLRERRVYLDLGANAFQTSIQWFMRMYPCDFTELHAFEITPNLLRLPDIPYDELNNTAEANPMSYVVNQVPGFPSWMLNRMKFYNKLVSDEDDDTTGALNITRFIKETLKLKSSDTVVVKMDIEGSEWPILKRWMDDPEMSEIIDELFVEIHYNHPSMAHYGWGVFPHTRDQATHLLAGLRSKGFFVHPWP